MHLGKSVDVRGGFGAVFSFKSTSRLGQRERMVIIMCAGTRR